MADDFAALILDRYQLAVGFHSDLAVSLEAFENHLMRISVRYLGSEATELAQMAFVKSLHTNDLLLALSCAMGLDVGWKRFYAVYRKYLSDLSRHLLGRTPDSEELGETIWIDLFLPDKSGQCRIASYDGRSSVATWLRVVVSNRVINERQRRSLSTGTIDSIPEPADPCALHNVEDLVRQQRYKDMIVGAFEKAFSALSDRETLIVLMRYDQGLQLGEIARLFSVHQSTISRQLDRVVGRLRCDVMVLLSSQYGLDRAQIDECLNVACDTFASSVSILSFLKTRAAPDISSRVHSANIAH